MLSALSESIDLSKDEEKDEEEETAWPTLDEALAKSFDINLVSTLK